MPTIEIDGKTIEVDSGKMIIEAADENDIPIPRFCYHKKLSVAANCRMCMVEIEKSGKPLPACATPVSDGMKVFTQSMLARDAQKAVMEFLLINHPLDCPVCDQGGECELQDVSMRYGRDISRYTEGKRAVDGDDLGSLIATDLTRCIHCTRCVRFGEEVAGFRELGMTGRGENSQIGTYIKHSVESEVSGNIIDLCPVGALTSKPFRYKARSWELQASSSISPHDAYGSNLHLHQRRGEVMRVVPEENEAINETWMSDRDRFSYTGLLTDRVQEPMIKQNDQWRTIDWTTALRFAIEGLQSVIATHGVDSVAGLASPNSTTEEAYLFQKWLRGMGVNNIDHRTRVLDTRDQNSEQVISEPFELSTLDTMQSCLLIGTDIHRELPLLALKIRQSQAQVAVINSIDYPTKFAIQNKNIVSPQQMIDAITTFEDAIKLDTILLGEVAYQHPHAAQIRQAAQALANKTGARLIMTSDGANSMGCRLAACIPNRNIQGELLADAGKSAHEMIQSQHRAYVLMNMEPELDCANPSTMQQHLGAADFTVCISPYINDAMRSYANVILPSVPFSETSGTFVNLAGAWQSFKGAVKPLGSARPAWKILRVLANIAEVDGFSFSDNKQVLEEIKKQITAPKKFDAFDVADKAQKQAGVACLTSWPIYRVDAIVRRAQPLQESAINETPAVHLHPTTISRLALDGASMVRVKTHTGNQFELPLRVNERLSVDCAYVPSGFEQTTGLGENGSLIEISKAG